MGQDDWPIPVLLEQFQLIFRPDPDQLLIPLRGSQLLILQESLEIQGPILLLQAPTGAWLRGILGLRIGWISSPGCLLGEELILPVEELLDI